MASLVTTTELIVWLDIADDTFPTDRATLLVNSASAAVRAHCGWNITSETVTGEVLDGSAQYDLWLQTLWLTAVASVAEDGVTLTHEDHYTWRRSGRLVRVGQKWSGEPKIVTTTYTHGYPTGHPRLELARAVCLQAAGRVVGNPGGLRSETIGAVSWTAAGSGSDVVAFLVDDEKASLGPLTIPPEP